MIFFNIKSIILEYENLYEQIFTIIKYTIYQTSSYKKTT